MILATLSDKVARTHKDNGLLILLMLGQLALTTIVTLFYNHKHEIAEKYCMAYAIKGYKLV